jgi:Peptidase family M48
MRTLRRILIIAALLTALLANVTWAQQPSVDQVVDRIVQRESEEDKILRQYHPIIETYVQDLRAGQELGTAPITDHYFLGRMMLSEGTAQRPSEVDKKEKSKSVKQEGLSRLFNKGTIADGFLSLIYVDSHGFDRQHYRFDYVRREFLGEVRCLVFDVSPLEEKGSDHFLGRIWVEDQDYTIVRFNGTNSSAEHSKAYRLHFDSWRMKVVPHVWVPAYIYSAESDVSNKLSNNILFQAQTLFWGYGPNNSTAEDRSVAESQAAPGHENEEVGLDRLQAAGLLAPTGAVDKVLYTIANNLAVSNNLDIEPDVACRVLLTSTMESFTIGHTILVSRGLLDVLPDEASLAMILAHELAHILSGRTLSDQWAVRDWSVFMVKDRFNHFGFPINAGVEEAANARAIQLLEGSPYKDKLGNSVLFLQMIGSQAQSLPSLISPHVVSQAPIANHLSALALSTATSKEHSITALSMGSRIELNPWTSQVDLLKSKPNALVTGGKRQDLLISPLIPHLVLQTTGRPVVQDDNSVANDPSKPRE